MKLMNAAIIPALIIVFVAFFVWKNKNERSFINWVKDHWFYLPSLENKLGRFLYYLGLGLLLFSLTDLRGPEEKVETTIPDQRTIIIIDSSASMLVEDIRPNRYEKSLLLARHFIKNAFGHQIAVVLFSDTQKRIVPFTDDLDLLDSRVAGLSGLDVLNGGSNISQAVLESVQYFKQNKGNIEKVGGNILVFTDAEEHEGLPIQRIDGDINLVMVGVGSLNGGPIPIRRRNNSFGGYKTFNGQKVVSKLDENYLKKFGEMVENYKYWVVSSYSIPTEEILDFFRNNFEAKLAKGKITSRPVYGHWIVLVAVLILCLSYILKLRKSFIIPLLVLIIFNPQIRANEEAPELDPELVKELENLKIGKVKREETLNLALKLMKAGDLKTASILYKENIRNTDEVPYKLNFGTCQIGARNFKEGLKNLENLYKENLNNTQVQKIIRENILFALKQEQSQRQKEQQQQDQENQQQNQDQQQNEDQQQNDQNQNNDQQKDGEQKENKEKDQQGKDKQKKDPKKQKPQDFEEKEKQVEKKRKMVKVPAMIKQLMGEDRKLQEKYIDTSTQDRRQNNSNRDW